MGKSNDEILSLSILIPGIIAIMRFNKINRIYFPFIFCIWIACCNELLCCYLMATGHYTSVNNNIYVLFEALLVITFFRKIGIFDRSQNLFLILVCGLILLWIWENFIMHNIIYISSWYRIIYSFLIVLLSITTINKLILLDINKPVEINNRHILKNPIFLICIGSVFYFTFKVLVEIFWLYGLNAGRDFRIKVYDILVYINLAVNLLYALAILWIPSKQTYMNLY